MKQVVFLYYWDLTFDGYGIFFCQRSDTCALCDHRHSFDYQERCQSFTAGWAWLSHERSFWNWMDVLQDHGCLQRVFVQGESVSSQISLLCVLILLYYVNFDRSQLQQFLPSSQLCIKPDQRLLLPDFDLTMPLLHPLQNLQILALN